MKDLIIIVGTIILSVFLFSMIVGDNNSLKSASKDVMIKSVMQYNK